MKKYKCNECGGNCYGCFYTELCDKWLDVAPYEPYFEEVDHASSGRWFNIRQYHRPVRP